MKVDVNGLRIIFCRELGLPGIDLHMADGKNVIVRFSCCLVGEYTAYKSCSCQ